MRKTVTVAEMFQQDTHDEMLKTNVFKADLYTNIVTPSAIHAYSIGVEFMKKWFYKGIPEDYFKFTWVNATHMMNEYRVFNKDHIKRDKPYLAIIPVPDLEFDRDRLDVYNAGNQMFLKRTNWQGSFFRDYEHRLFLNMQMRVMKIDFTFRVRTNTRAQQLDLYRRMELAFNARTRTYWIGADFVIPYELCTNIAYFAGFKINTIGEIEDPLAFLAYLNSKSDIPVTYKFRAINGHNEFFLRLNDVYAHVSTMDKIDADEGEKDGMIDTNFGIEMKAELKMAIPQFFVLYNEDELKYRLETKNSPVNVSLYTMAQFVVPDANDKGWNQIINTAYALDEGEQNIDISPMFQSTKTQDIKQVIDWNLNNYISPRSFIDVKIYQDMAGSFQEIPFRIHFGSMTIELVTPAPDERYIYIAIYVDLGYVNNTLATITDMYEGRIKAEGTGVYQD